MSQKNRQGAWMRSRGSMEVPNSFWRPRGVKWELTQINNDFIIRLKKISLRPHAFKQKPTEKPKGLGVDVEKKK